jgi:predicted RND superfamily exporter protein
VASERNSLENLHFIKPKILVFFSLLTILFSSFWIDFDFNLKNLDVDNKKLKQTESFFYKHMREQQNRNFMIKANSIDALITYAKEIVQNTPTAKVSLSSLVNSASFEKNQIILIALQGVRQNLDYEANKLGFKKEYFKDAYTPLNNAPSYTLNQIKDYGMDILKIDESYITYGIVDRTHYQDILKYSFVEDLSLKERFEVSMKSAISILTLLGILSSLVIVLLIYLFTKNTIFYALTFLLFPVAVFTLYALFITINILHIFMIFIILAIGIDYAIYLSRENDRQTTRAIHYSLISTFAGFGVLIFSDLNALHSMGIVATMGILSIIVLLLFLKGENDVS